MSLLNNQEILDVQATSKLVGFNQPYEFPCRVLEIQRYAKSSLDPQGTYRPGMETRCVSKCISKQYDKHNAKTHPKSREWLTL